MADELFKTAPEEVVRFFRSKSDRPAFDWRDVAPEEHAYAFTVAKATSQDILADIRAAVDDAIVNRVPFEAFKARLQPILEAKGWWGRKLVLDPKDDRHKLAQLGSPRRLRTIYWAIRCDPSTLTDLERAARFLYLQKTAFGGKVTGQTFGVTKDGGARFNLTRLAPLLEEVHERMAGVIIECLGWAEFIDRWDRAGMLFYLDPPYWNGETDYGKGVFSRADFAALAKRLRKLKGSFVLSINDVPEVRKAFAAFEMTPVSLIYTLSDRGSTPAKELIITREAGGK